MPSDLDDYSDALSRLPTLGAVVLYGVTTMNMPHARFVDMLKAEGLARHAPKAPSDVDVFRRICSAAQIRRVPTRNPEIFVNVMIRDVANDDDEVVKRIVSELCNPSGRVLEHTCTHDLVFRRKSGAVRVRPLIAGVGVVHAEADTVAGGIVPTYLAQRGSVNSNHVRDTLKRVIDAHHAVPLKTTGGAFFVPAYEMAAVLAAQRVADQIHEADFNAIPLIDTKRHRNMVAMSFESDTAAEIDRLIAELTEKLHAGSQLSAELYATYLRRYQDAAVRADTYAELLDERSAVATGRLAQLDKVMQVIRERGTPAARGRKPGVVPALTVPTGAVHPLSCDCPACAGADAPLAAAAAA